MAVGGVLPTRIFAQAADATADRATEAASPAITPPPKVKADLSAPDLSTQPTLYVMPYAHLDTQWRWAYPETIEKFISKTLTQNFAMIDKYPNYIFNFTGSRRYTFMKEYYPKDFEKLKAYVHAGRWFPAGSSVDENDANTPSGESLLRNVLYGNKFFRKEFGVASDEYMIPDCFGFPAAVPEILAHCGITGFSTQKLTWNACIPIPFPFGVWVGPDGSGVMAALNPGAYNGDVEENLATDPKWIDRVKENGKKTGVAVDYHYYGTGDTGGAPREPSIAMMEKSLATKSDVKLIQGPADLIFKAVTPEQRAKLPTYKGELELTQHSAGSLTSQAATKRWNRKDELLADAAERAAVTATWLGARSYPGQRFENAWYLLLGSQMHDNVSGTALATGYNYLWNDQLLAANQFSSILKDSAGAVISTLDTQTKGTPIVVYNPTSAEREDVVEIDLPAGAPANGASVLGPDGAPAPCQVTLAHDGTPHLIFLAKAPSVGYAVYSVDASTPAAASAGSLKVSERQLENDCYIVKLNDNGDVSSIHDKKADRELLSAPATLGLFYENPQQWPAWNMDWTDRQKPATSFVGGSGPVTFKVVEDGPVRVAVEITRVCERSTYVQRVRLSAGGAAPRVEFDNDIDWKTRVRSLRAAFPLTVSNPNATYDLQAGTLQRGNYKPNMYEYGFQQWFDLTDAKKDYGVTVMSDSKFGSDKPSDDTLRLTLLYTPGNHGGYLDQATQDLGHHHILYALYGHSGDWSTAHSPLQAARLNQPLIPFTSSTHDGPMGKSFSLAKVSDPNVAIQAIKKSEAGDEIIVRLRQLSGETSTGVKLSFDSPIVSAREVDGQEREIGKASVSGKELTTDINGFSLKTFAIKFGDAPTKVPAMAAAPVELSFDTDVASTNANRGDGAFNSSGETYPAELLPSTLMTDGVEFKLGSTADGQKNAVAAKGQDIPLPSGDYDHVYLLAAADEDVASAPLTIDGKQVPWSVQSWTGFVGQWDTRLWPRAGNEHGVETVGLDRGYIKKDEVAWFATHHHTPTGDAYYRFSYLYAYPVEIPAGTKAITLPNDPRVKIFAATMVKTGAHRAAPAAPLFDTLKDHIDAGGAEIAVGKGPFNDSTEVSVKPGLYWRANGLRYTTDGSDPTADSAKVDGKILISKTSTLKVAMVDAAGNISRPSVATVDVNDVTAPSITRIDALQNSKSVIVQFSEPVDPATVQAGLVSISPKGSVISAKVLPGNRGMTVELGEPLAAGEKYELKLSGIKDVSPAGNAMQSTQMPFTAIAPVYSVDKISAEMQGKPLNDVAGLPTKGTDSWTINTFVRAARVPNRGVLIVGFGALPDQGTPDGASRYIGSIPEGMHFWARGQDVSSGGTLVADRWQMLTAAFDGTTLRLYLDAELVSEAPLELTDAKSDIYIAPPDARRGRGHYEGDLSGLTIWNAALSPEVISSLKEGMPR